MSAGSRARRAESEEEVTTVANFSIRPATTTDIAGLTAIRNDVIATSTAIFNDQPETVEARLAWFEAQAEKGFPVLVAVLPDGSNAGYASFGEFRSWPGYRYTVENAIHVHRDWRGHGIGRALMETLIPLAVAGGKHVMIAGVDASNEASIQFHESLGFERTGTIKEVGHKFGRWLDLVFLQRWLDVPGARRS